MARHASTLVALALGFLSAPSAIADTTGPLPPPVAKSDPSRCQPPRRPNLATHDPEGVIVRADQGPCFYEALPWKAGPDATYFTPTLDEVHLAEVALTHRLPKQAYKRQYLGLVVRGERRLWINGFCAVGGQDWRSVVIFYDPGGGDCFFQATVDLERRKVTRLVFNPPS